MFANVPLAKVTRSRLDVRVGEIDFTSWWEKMQSHTVMGCGFRKGTIMVPFLHTLHRAGELQGNSRTPFLAWLRKDRGGAPWTQSTFYKALKLVHKLALGTGVGKKSKAGHFQARLPFLVSGNGWQRLSCSKYMSDVKIRHDTKVIIHCLISSLKYLPLPTRC